jgi:hypothetical protein
MRAAHLVPESKKSSEELVKRKKRGSFRPTICRQRYSIASG